MRHYSIFFLFLCFLDFHFVAHPFPSLTLNPLSLSRSLSPPPLSLSLSLSVSLCLSLKPSTTGSFPEQERDRILDLLFDAEEGLGMEIVRYNVGGSGWGTPDEGNLRAGANVEALLVPASYSASSAAASASGDSAQWTYDWTRDEPQRRCLLGARQRGAHTFEAFANSPPFFMTKSGRASGAGWGCAANLPRDRIDDFARYLVDVVAHYKEAYGLTFTSIAPFNEPREICWWAGTNQEGCRFRLPDQRRVVRCLASRLKEAGLAANSASSSAAAASPPPSASSRSPSSSENKKRDGVRIAISDENRIDRALSSLEATLGRRLVVRYRKEDGQPYAKLKGLTAEELALVGHVSTHAYAGLEARLPLRVVAEAAGVDVWMSEVGYGNAPPSKPESATHIAENIAADINRMRSCAWVYWQGVEDSDGGSWRGLMKLRPVSSLGFRALFALQQKYYSTKQKLAAAAVKRRILREKEKTSSSKAAALEEAEKVASEFRRPWWGLLLVSFGAPRGEKEKVKKGGGEENGSKRDLLVPPDITSKFKRRGLHPAADPRDALYADDLVASKQFYGLKQFSKHIRSGFRIAAVPWSRADDVVVAFSGDGAKAVCVAVNNGSSSSSRSKKRAAAPSSPSSSSSSDYFSPGPDGSREIAFDLGPFLRGSSSKGARVSVFVTDAERDAEKVESFEIDCAASSSAASGKKGGGENNEAALLTYTLPSLSVATFVVEKKK